MGADRLHWADDFDADLHRVVPEARAALGIDAGARLWLLHEPRTDAMFVTPVFFTRNDAARSIGLGEIVWCDGGVARAGGPRG